MPVHHADNRAGIEAEEAYAAVFKVEPLGAEDMPEIGSARFAPFGFMVAGNSVIFHVQLV